MKARNNQRMQMETVIVLLIMVIACVLLVFGAHYFSDNLLKTFVAIVITLWVIARAL